jgi:hypothetical protein
MTCILFYIHTPCRKSSVGQFDDHCALLRLVAALCCVEYIQSRGRWPPRCTCNRKEGVLYCIVLVWKKRESGFGFCCITISPSVFFIDRAQSLDQTIGTIAKMDGEVSFADILCSDPSPDWTKEKIIDWGVWCDLMRRYSYCKGIIL